MTQKPFSLAVRAMISDDRGRCLLMRRSKECGRFVGTWEWPGGKSDPGETFDVALLREVVEETGLEIEITGVAGAYGIVMQGYPIPVLCMEAKVVGGVFRLSEEHDDFTWTPLADLTNWELTEGFHQFAQQYIDNIQNKTEGD